MTDRSSRAPHGFEIVASATPARVHCEVLLERGVLAKDTHETTIRFAPPLVITEEDRQVRDVGYEDCAHGSMLHADDSSFMPSNYFEELFRRRRPLRDSVVWIAAYDVGRYPVSDSGRADSTRERFPGDRERRLLRLAADRR
jgi:hypothetical protein